MCEENYRENNAQPSPKVTNLEQFVVRQQLMKKGRMNSMRSDWKLAVVFWGVWDRILKRTLKCSMATMLSVTARKSPYVLGDPWEKH